MPYVCISARKFDSIYFQSQRAPSELRNRFSSLCNEFLFLKHILADVTLNTIFWDDIFHRKQMSAIIPFLTSETYQSQIGNHPIRRAYHYQKKSNYNLNMFEHDYYKL